MLSPRDASRSCSAVAALLVAAAVSSLAVAGSIAAPGGRWVVRDLGARIALESEDGSFLVGPEEVTINDKGDVGGTRDVGGHVRGFLWHNGQLTNIGPLPGDTDSNVIRLNEQGQVIGSSWNVRTLRSRAFLWQRQAIHALGVLPSRAVTQPAGINDLGQIVGWSGTSADAQGSVAFLWQVGKMQSLGTLPRQAESEAVAINNSGQVIGSSGPNSLADGAGREVAFLWTDGKMRSLGKPAGCSGTRPMAINEAGQVVGDVIAKEGPCAGTGAFIWQEGKMAAMRLPDTGVDWSPMSINNHGHVALNGLDEWILWQRGAIRHWGTGEVMALNERDQVAIADWDNAVPRIWDNGRITRLPLLPGDQGGAATSLNEHDQVVGFSGTWKQTSLPGQHIDGEWECHVVLWTWQGR